MNRKHEKIIYHANVKVSLMVENVTHIKSGITISIDVSVKIRISIVYAKNIIFVILLHVVAKIVNMQEVLLTIQ